jgi:hypothetical protein
MNTAVLISVHVNAEGENPKFEVSDDGDAENSEGS